VESLGASTQLSLNNAQFAVQALQHDLEDQRAQMQKQLQNPGMETERVTAKLERDVTNFSHNPYWQNPECLHSIIAEGMPSAPPRSSKRKYSARDSTEDSDSEACAFRLVKPKPMRETASGVPNIGSVHQVNVRPVGMSQGMYSQMPVYMHPLQQEVLKSLVKPKFTGYTLDWAQFAKDWEKYLCRMSCGVDLSDGDKMALLEGCLDPESQLWLQSNT
jgi:hypothetical protein